MPPLVILICVVVAFLFILARFDAMPGIFRPTLKELPFIVDVTHGICPMCEASNPKQALKPGRDEFWQQFDCHKCGYQLRAHIEDRSA